MPFGCWKGWKSKRSRASTEEPTPNQKPCRWLRARGWISHLLGTSFSYLTCFNSLLTQHSCSQCDGEPFAAQSKPAEQRGCSVQLSLHLAGVCGGLGLLEGAAAAGGHCPSFSGHCLLCQWRTAIFCKSAGVGPLRARLCYIPGPDQSSFEVKGGLSGL